MSENFNWICPTCGVHTVITAPNCNDGKQYIHCRKTSQDQVVLLGWLLVECPNESCKAQCFAVSADHVEPAYSMGQKFYHNERPLGIGVFTFVPTTSTPLSKHVPKHVSDDYNEAYLIKSLSPKASATLARRALQGMVRDFFGVQNKPNLHQELEAIKDKCDEDLYKAMMAVKSVGNIGAHPEKDVSLMVEVEPGEPETLLELIHLLDKEWYVHRADRQDRIGKMKALGDSKKIPNKTPNPAAQK